VQAYANPREVLLAVDRPGLLRGPVQHLVHAAHADCHAQQVAHELHHAAIRTAADQRQSDHHLAQPGPGDRQLEQHLVIGYG
jgi:hypothetical protein